MFPSEPRELDFALVPCTCSECTEPLALLTVLVVASLRLNLWAFLYGVGVAFAMHAAPVYIAEVAPPALRGLLVALKEGFIVGGILAGFAASAAATAHDLPPALAFRAIWSPPLLIGTLILAGTLENFVCWAKSEACREEVTLMEEGRLFAYVVHAGVPSHADSDYEEQAGLWQPLGTHACMPLCGWAHGCMDTTSPLQLH